MRIHDWLIIVCARRFLAEARGLQAAGLTFYTLFALAPLLALALSLIGWVSFAPDQAALLEEFFFQHFVPQDAGAIDYYIHSFVISSERLSKISLMVFLLTSIVLVRGIEHCFNQIWHVTRPMAIVRRLTHYTMVLIVSPVCLGLSMGVSVLLLSSSWLQHPLIISGLGELIKLLPFVLTWLAISILYYWLPNTKVGTVNALAAAFIVAFLFELMKHYFQLYIVLFPTYKTYQIVYGAMALLPIFFLWIYISWMAVLYGAIWAAEMRKAKAVV